MPYGNPRFHQRAKVAALSRSRQPDDPELLDARRALAVESLAEQVRKVADVGVVLSDDQRNHLAALLESLSIEGVDGHAA